MSLGGAAEDLDGLLGRPVRDVLEDVSRQQIATAAGSASALTAAFAAALVSMVARAARRSWPDSGGAIAAAESLRVRLCVLAASDAKAYQRARELLQRGGADREHHGAGVAPAIRRLNATERGAELAGALDEAAAVPLAIAEAAAELAALAAWTAESGGADHRADAVVATVLAEAAARGCAHLVQINLGVHPDNQVGTRARAAATAAMASRDRALSPAV
jgi:formiminotetrahydrofolate cyclodeaminase